MADAAVIDPAVGSKVVEPKTMDSIAGAGSNISETRSTPAGERLLQGGRFHRRLICANVTPAWKLRPTPKIGGEQ
jgi:hypothetical protein